jgi:hypothetical protein
MRFGSLILLLIILTPNVLGFSAEENQLYSSAKLVSNTYSCGGDIMCEAIFSIDIPSETEIQPEMWFDDRIGTRIQASPITQKQSTQSELMRDQQ